MSGIFPPSSSTFCLLTSAFADAAAPAPKFALFGPLHLAILFFTLGLPFALSYFTRRDQRPRLARGLALALAAILLLDRVFVLIWVTSNGKIVHWANALPMHLCDWATFAVIIALLWRRPLPYELAYLWGLSGTFQAVLTPDVSESPLDPLFAAFFVSHCGIIISALFLTWGFGMRPRPGAVVRVWLWSQVYLICAGLVNWVFRASDPNFGYLAHKPSEGPHPHGSLLDWFGPWPWYIVTLELMALVFYTVFYAPFWFGNRRRAALLNAPTIGASVPPDRSSATGTLPPRTDKP